MAIVKDLGVVTAYAYAVAGGYVGTEAEFTEALGKAGITVEQLENLTAVATTLSEGAEATASYADGVLTFGIPKGDTGATGPQGEQGVKGDTGNGIVSIAKTATDGKVDTYTITFTDGATTTFDVTNGADGDITNVAQAFDATKTYSVGDMVLYQGTLYAFTAAHAAGAWVGSDAQAVILVDEVTALRDDLSDVNERFDDAISTHKNFLPDTEYYENYYWKRTAPLDRTSSNNHKAYYGIPVVGGRTYYYKHIFLYYTVVVYSGSSTPTTLTDDTTQDVSGTFTPVSNGTIYITVSKAYTPVFTDDEEIYNSLTGETYYTPNKLIVTKTEENLSFTVTNEKAILNTDGNEVVANSYWNASSFVDISRYQKIKLFSAFQNTLAGAFYDEDGNFIIGVPCDADHSATAYEYNLDIPPSAKYIRFTIYTYQSGVTVNTAYIKGVIESLQNINADVKEINNVIAEPLTNLPKYVQGLMSYRPIGCLDKGYIMMSCDDGSAGLATYTIPMLAQKDVPATFGLFATSDVITNPTYLQTLIGAIEDGCAVAMHGVQSWSDYSEYYLNRYFEETEASLYDSGITEINGAICPGVAGKDDTSELIRCVAGGRYGAVCSGGTHDEISYGSYYCAGKRTNIYAMRRMSIIRLTQAQYQAAINYAYDNHMIFMPFWHDYDIVNNAEYKAIIEGMIDYAKTKGLTFITMKDLPYIK